MSERQGFLVRNGLVAAGALAMLMLVMLFYSTVSGAVDRAARHHADAVGGARAVAQPARAPQLRSVASLGRSGS